MKTTAVLVVKSAKVFTWLGHMPIMNWSVTQILEVRGIDQIVCCADPKLVERARTLLGKEDIEVIPIPRKAADNLNKWLACVGGPAEDSDVIAVVQPTSPFLPAAKIETCVDTVTRQLADTCCTVREVNACLTGQKTYMLAPAYAQVPGCIVFAPARVIEPIHRFKPVPVSLIESLDVCDPDNLRIASALVNSGLA